MKKTESKIKNSNIRRKKKDYAFLIKDGFLFL